MNNTPILILQMQRMGDLILTFPLMGWLQQHVPEHPLWVVSEPRFFQELMDLAPKAVFFPPEAAERLASTAYHAVINLSHRSDAARLCGALRTEQRVGPHIRGQARYIEGFWQLYRASIVHNNRHNHFHWGDLNLLDTVPLNALPTVRHPESGTPSAAARGCVGLFVGASEPEKRPEPHFWGALAKQLLRKGIRPLFFGGPDDRPLAKVAEQVAGVAGCNLCGRFSLTQLAHALRALDLFVTSDTGPMHLAAWIGTPVLNLSMGPVNAWETGPIAAGHLVLRPTVSCNGCWRCGHSHPPCRDAFRPGPVAATIHRLLTERGRVPQTDIPGLALYRTGRDALGLYTLHRTDGKTASPRERLGAFWQAWFLSLYAPDKHSENVSRVLARLAAIAPELVPVLRRATRALSVDITRHIRRGGLPLTQDFWRAYPPVLRPLTSYLHLRLQNEEYSAACRHAVLDMVAQLIAQFEEI